MFVEALPNNFASVSGEFCLQGGGKFLFFEFGSIRFFFGRLKEALIVTGVECEKEKKSY